MAIKTVRAIISGRVQGVCFRMETERAAEKCGVNGWVRNRRDGSVEALFQGESQNVNDVLKWCGQGPPMAIVTKVDVFDEPFQAGLAGFIIRHTA
jgi:acylphosphatase